MPQIRPPYLKLRKLVRLAAGIFCIDQFGKKKLPKFRVLEWERLEEKLDNPRPREYSTAVVLGERQ